MHTAAMKPAYLSREDVPTDVLEHEKEVIKAEIANDPSNASKPENIIEKMVMGRLAKFKKEICLVDQAFVKDPSMTIEKLVKSVGDKMGKTLSIKRFVRFEMGEGLEKRSDNFAEEVAAQMKK